MRAFVLRARSAPTDSEQFLASVGQEAHVEILAHTLMNTIFVAQSHRDDVIVYLVLESTKDYSKGSYEYFEINRNNNRKNSKSQLTQISE